MEAASATTTSARRRNVQRFGIAAGTVCLVAVAAAIYVHELWPRRLAVVDEGRLYRSGDVTPAQLARVQQRYGIGRVVSLLDANAPQTHAEREAARALGIEWQNIPLRGDGSSGPADRERLRALLLDANAPPTLVHCSAGVNRTGLAVGLYRICQQGWPLDRVLDEMRSFGFEDLDKHENLRAALAEAAAETATRPAHSAKGGVSSPAP